MVKKKLEIFFLGIIIVALGILGYNTYSSYRFKHSALPQSYQDAIHAKEQEVLQRMEQNFGRAYRFPLIVTDKIPGRLYGLTSYDKGEIKIYLNKKVMQESFEYMVEDVIPHEYAHALMMAFGYMSNHKGGHTRQWQSICQKLGGRECRQYVNQKEIIMSKLPF